MADDVALPNRCRFVMGAILGWMWTLESKEDGFLDLAEAGTVAIGDRMLTHRTVWRA